MAHSTRAARFYEHHGFVRLTPEDDTQLRLAIKVSTVRKQLQV